MMKNSLDDGNLQRLHKHEKNVNRMKAEEEFHSHLLNNFNNRDIFLYLHLPHTFIYFVNKINGGG